MMQLATFSWEWVLTGSPSLSISMLAEIMDAWIWTINKKLGIFTGSKAVISLSTLHEIDDSAQSSSIDGIKAHDLWLSFLSEQWEVSCHAPSDTLMAHTGVFARLLTHSLHHPHSLSHHPAAAGARFKLLTLGLKYCQFFADRNSDSVTAAVLYERIIRAGLAWFEYPQSWYGQRTRIEGEEEVMAVKTFTYLLARWPQKSNLNGRRIAKSGRLLASVWHMKASWNREMSDRRRDLLIHLCRREIDRLQVWVCPIPNADLAVTRETCDWSKNVNTAWAVHPRLALALLSRYPKIPSIENELFSLIRENATNPTVQALPQAALFLATSDPIKRLKAGQKVELLKHWALASIHEALSLLVSDQSRPSIVKSFVVASLDKADPEQLALYLPQLIQGLRHDSDGALQDLLRHKAAQSWVFCHKLMWYLRSEFKPPPEAMNPAIKRSGWKAPADTGLWNVTVKLYDTIMESLDEKQKTFLNSEMGFFDKITSISGVLKPIPADERRGKIEEILRTIPLEREDLYLPTNPGSIVKQVINDSGAPMPSKEKMPILVQFQVFITQDQQNEEESQNSKNEIFQKQALIFKVGDDVRQDVLALQIIKILKDVFIKAGLDLYLCPYGVIPTGYEKGVIEVVPNSKSRSALGETTDGGLYEIFQREFGPPGSQRFEAARHNFMVSEAGYAIASLLLQCKDRHNGNILIDSEGHLVHIDFGFILEISPGNNLKFESADFKLSHEMTQLLDPGGMRNSQFYHSFEEMCIRAFLAARNVAEPIITCVALMKHSGLPCFDIGHAVDNLRSRFHLEKSEKQVAAIIRAMVVDAYCKWTTAYYDKLQKYTY